MICIVNLSPRILFQLSNFNSWGAKSHEASGASGCRQGSRFNCWSVCRFLLLVKGKFSFIFQASHGVLKTCYLFLDDRIEWYELWESLCFSGKARESSRETPSKQIHRPPPSCHAVGLGWWGLWWRFCPFEVRDAFAFRRKFYIVMEYVNGTDLGRRREPQGDKS